MNFELIILLSVAACAFALPLPDEEVSTLQKSADVVEESVTSIVDLVKSEPSLITLEEGANANVANATIENLPKLDIESELGKPTEVVLETTTSEDDIKEVPKSMPVVAREENQPAAPFAAGVRAEPKETVEIAEAKSTASSPGADETVDKSDSKSTDVVPLSTSTETNISGSIEKKDETPSTEEKASKPEGTEEKPSSSKPSVAGENKTEDSAPATDSKKSDKPNTKSKPSESEKPTKHDHSSEGNKSEESAESKESEESDESNKSK